MQEKKIAAAYTSEEMYREMLGDDSLFEDHYDNNSDLRQPIWGRLVQSTTATHTTIIDVDKIG